MGSGRKAPVTAWTDSTLLTRGLKITSRFTASIFGQMAAYATGLTAAIYAFKKLEQPLEGLPSWVRVTIVGAPVLLALIFHTIPSLIEEHRQNLLKRMAIDGRNITPGYFSLAPREDEKSFKRADQMHHEVLHWIENRPAKILYLTGVSGSGKSSLILAWIKPQFERQNCKIILLRGYQSPIDALRRELTPPGATWRGTPDGEPSVLALLEQTARTFSPDRLLVIFDQFEEALILQDSSQIEEVRRLLDDLNTNPLPNLSVLLVFRSDYAPQVHKLSLPALRQGENWMDIPSFTERDARAFLLASGMKVSDELLHGVLREASELDQTKGLVRPVTINLCGLVLSRFASGIDKGFRPGFLVRGFLKEALTLPSVREIAPRIISYLISPSVTKIPMTIDALVWRTKLDPTVIHGCLLTLGGPGRVIVRPLDPDQQTWEISHDFLVPLLDSIVAHGANAAWRASRPYLPWIAAALLLPFALHSTKNGAPSGPKFGTLSAIHDLEADNRHFQDINHSKVGPIPISRGGEEPILRLRDVYGPQGQNVEDAITASGRIVFQAAGSTGFVSGDPTAENSGTTSVAQNMEDAFRTDDAKNKPSFLFLLGDEVFNFGESQYYFSEFYRPYLEYPAPILAIAGNHDGMVVPGMGVPSLNGFLENFCATGFHTTNSSGGVSRTAQIQPGVYFTFEAPFLRIIALYSNTGEVTGAISDENGRHPQLSDVQLRFVERAFNRIKAERFDGAILVLVHHNPYSPGSHQASAPMLADLDSISKRTGVWPHAVLSGHSINYQRYTRQIGERQIPYINAGDGGHTLSKLEGPDRGGPKTPLILTGVDGHVTLNRYDDEHYGFVTITVDRQRLVIDFEPVEIGAGRQPVADSVSVDLRAGRLASSIALQTNQR